MVIIILKFMELPIKLEYIDASRYSNKTGLTKLPLKLFLTLKIIYRIWQPYILYIKPTQSQ